MKHSASNAARYVIAALVSVTTMLSGCTESVTDDNATLPVGDKITIKATTERRVYSSETGRTSLGGNDEVLWSKGDTIVVYDAGSYNSQTFVLESGAGTTSATFSGYKPSGSSFIAFYGDNTRGGGLLALPAEQRYVAGGFADYVNPMLAVSDNLENGLAFQNLMGVLELNVTGTKSVQSITVSADGMLLSGNVSVDTQSLELTPYGETSNSVSLVDINEALNESTASRFNVVVPPATYENLNIRINNTDGTYVERTSADPITVGRNQIVPIMGLEDGEDANASVVSLFIDENYSNLFDVVVYSQMSEDCSRFVYLCATRDLIDEWKSQNPNGTERDMVLTEGSTYDSDIQFMYSDVTDIEYHFYAIGYNIDGEEQQMVHLTYFAQVPYDDNMTLTVSLPDENIGETEAMPLFKCTGNMETLYVCVTEKSYIENMMFGSIFRWVSRSPQYAISMNGEGETVLTLGDLMPDTEYTIMSIGESPDNKYSRLNLYEFSTKSHVPSSAAATASSLNIEDIKASFNISMNETAVSYKALALNHSSYSYEYYTSNNENMADVVANWDDGYLESAIYGDTPVLTVDHLDPESDYTLYMIAYDADGSYGTVFSCEFTTVAYFPVYDQQYNKFLGEWSVSYKDRTTGALISNAYNISISAGVEGKTFLVSGLAGPDYINYYGFDDTFVARFIDNQIHMFHGTPIADVGLLSEYYIEFYVMSDAFSHEQAVYVGTLSDERVAFAGRFPGYDPSDTGFDSDYNFNRCTFMAYDKYSGNTAGYVGMYLVDLVLDKVPQTNAGSSTQQFDRVNPINPSWR